MTGKAWLHFLVILGLILATPHPITLSMGGDTGHLRASRHMADFDEPAAAGARVECSIQFGCSMPALPPAGADALYLTRSSSVRGVTSGRGRPMNDAPYHPPKPLTRA